MTTLTGFLPAAGRGTRFGDSGYAKEIFPILATDDEYGPLELRPICDLALAALARAGAERAVIMISPDKTEIVRVLGARRHHLPLAYVVQPSPRGLPDAITRARPWLGDDVLLVLPDTVVLPEDALATVHRARAARDADLTLGVFPVDEPHRLGPVELEADGRVRRVHDKPSSPPARNSWGVASWGPRFTDFLCAWETERGADPGERVLGHVFDAARAAGLAVTGVPLDDGTFLDLGTPHGLRLAMETLARHGKMDAAQSSRTVLPKP